MTSEENWEQLLLLTWWIPTVKVPSTSEELKWRKTVVNLLTFQVVSSLTKALTESVPTATTRWPSRVCREPSTSSMKTGRYFFLAFQPKYVCPVRHGERTITQEVRCRSRSPEVSIKHFPQLLSPWCSSMDFLAEKFAVYVQTAHKGHSCPYNSSTENSDQKRSTFLVLRPGITWHSMQQKLHCFMYFLFCLGFASVWEARSRHESVCYTVLRDLQPQTTSSYLGLRCQLRKGRSKYVGENFHCCPCYSWHLRDKNT